jgi:hypothetical protein
MSPRVAAARRRIVRLFTEEQRVPERNPDQHEMSMDEWILYGPRWH